MFTLKKYRDGVCVTTERFQERSTAIRLKKEFEKSYSTHQKSERKIYAIIKTIKA